MKNNAQNCDTGWKEFATDAAAYLVVQELRTEYRFPEGWNCAIWLGIQVEITLMTPKMGLDCCNDDLI